MTLLDTYIVLNAFLEIAIPILAAAVILEVLFFSIEEISIRKSQKIAPGADWNYSPPRSTPEDSSSQAMWTTEPHRNEKLK